MAEDHHLSIDAEPVIVSGARDELHRLVLNLIENAVEHTAPGTHINVSTAVEDGEAILVVEDDGPGIPSELERRVFERFVRGGGEGGRGAGLGLSIVRAVAESHGGSVTLTRPRKGVRFVVRLPAENSSANESAGNGQTSTTTGRTIGRRRSRS
jgi:two-component system OmpR family sensor kinase